MLELVLRISLLVLSAAIALPPIGLGSLGLFLTVIFCDQGPMSLCLYIGVFRMAFCWGIFATWPLLGVVALSIPSRWSLAYLSVYPFILLSLGIFLKVQTFEEDIRPAFYVYLALSLLALGHRILCFTKNRAGAAKQENAR